MTVVGLMGSYPSTKEMVLIPPRIEFSNVRYISGSHMRSSSTYVCFRAMYQAREGRMG